MKAIFQARSIFVIAASMFLLSTIILGQAPQLKPKNGKPSPKETSALAKQIQEEFQLHELAIEDAHRAHQRPKIETYGDTLFIVLRTVQIHPDDRLIVGDDNPGLPHSVPSLPLWKLSASFQIKPTK